MLACRERVKGGKGRKGGRVEWASEGGKDLRKGEGRKTDMCIETEERGEEDERGRGRGKWSRDEDKEREVLSPWPQYSQPRILQRVNWVRWLGVDGWLVRVDGMVIYRAWVWQGNWCGGCVAYRTVWESGWNGGVWLDVTGLESHWSVSLIN